MHGHFFALRSWAAYRAHERRPRSGRTGPFPAGLSRISLAPGPVSNAGAGWYKLSYLWPKGPSVVGTWERPK